MQRPKINVFLFGVLTLAVWTVTSTHHNLYAGSKQYRVVGTYWASGDALNHGHNPYAPQPLTALYHAVNNTVLPDLNLNPPILLPLFQLLAKTSPNSAFIAWTLGSFLLFIGTSGFLIWRFPDLSDPCIILLLLGAPIHDTLGLGQLYALLYLLSAITWWAILRHRDIPAVGAIGLLVAMKPVFILWPVFLAISGRWRLAAYSLAVTLGLSIAPVVCYGYAIVPDWLVATRGDQHFSVPIDISIPAVFERMGHTGAGYVIVVALLAFLIAYTLRMKPGVGITSGIALSASLLCSPLAWLQYTLVLFPALAAGPDDRYKKTIIIILSVPTFFPMLIATAPGSRRLVGELYLFAPTCLLLIWFLLQAQPGKEGQAKNSEAP
jgi:hypothetical protein